MGSTIVYSHILHILQVMCTRKKCLKISLCTFNFTTTHSALQETNKNKLGGENTLGSTGLFRFNPCLRTQSSAVNISEQSVCAGWKCAGESADLPSSPVMWNTESSGSLSIAVWMSASSPPRPSTRLRAMSLQGESKEKPSEPNRLKMSLYFL